MARRLDSLKGTVVKQHKLGRGSLGKSIFQLSELKVGISLSMHIVTYQTAIQRSVPSGMVSTTILQVLNGDLYADNFNDND